MRYEPSGSAYSSGINNTRFLHVVQLGCRYGDDPSEILDLKPDALYLDE